MLTTIQIAEYCAGCYYYRGLPEHKKQCYYRVWHEKDITAPSTLLRVMDKCKYAKHSKRR
jgi:hypothetical protein